MEPSILSSHKCETLFGFGLSELGYNYAKLFHTRSGSRLVANGMRRLRARVLDEGFQVIVYAGNELGVFHIEEIAALLGAPPKMSFRRATDVSPP